MRIILLLLTIIFIFGACSEYPSKVETVVPKLDPVAEQYAVYSVLINQYASDKGLMINNQTTIDKFSGRSPEQTFQSYDLTIPPEFQIALEDYITKNKESEQLTQSFNIKADYKFVTEKELQSYSKGQQAFSAWKTAYLAFSRVGFDAEMKHAFVYVEYVCGSLCADGSYRLLTKEDGVWKETKRLSFWAS
jgi:hypothetical protein